jgi:hypothetical protein
MFHLEGKWVNNLSGVYVITVAGRKLLLGGHAHVERWRRVLADKQAREVVEGADAFLLPHLAVHGSLSAEVLRAVVSPGGFAAFLTTSQRFRRPQHQIPDYGVLAAVRAAGGALVVCGEEPVHGVLNGDGVFQRITTSDK